MQSWSGLQLTQVAATGVLTQLYPTLCPTGVVPAAATAGQLIREPCEGKLLSVQVEPDGSHGGTVEIWDVNGHDGGVDVSSATTITNAELTALAARGLASLLYRMPILADGSTPTRSGPTYFNKGLAARFSSGAPAGSCYLNLVVEGGYRLRQKVG